MSAFDQVAAQVRPDGTVSTATALAAFSLAIAPLPGVSAPPGPRRTIPSGTLAIAWVAAHWAELTPAQQEAVRHALSNGILPAANAVTQGAPVDPHLPCASADSAGAAAFRSQADDIVKEINKHRARQLGIPLFIEVNKRNLEQPSLMYTWGCRGRLDHDQFTGKVTGCTIHINPSAGSAKFDDHDRRAFLTHEIMHCFLYDQFGTSYLKAAPWLIEGIPTWVQAALNDGDKRTTELWNRYLKLDQASLFRRAYTAVGFFAQLAGSGVDVWDRIDPMIIASMTGGNTAAWNATGASDAFLDSWAPGHARGRHSGAHWDITGFGVPATRPDVAHVVLGTGATARAAAPVAGVDLIEVELRADIVSVSGTGTVHGLFGAADGSERPAAGMVGGDFCAKPDGCSCPPGSPTTAAQLPRLAAGTGYLGVSGGPSTASVTLRGRSLEEFCAKAKPKPASALPDACTLLTPQDVQEITGVAMSETHRYHTTEQGIETAYCEYQAPRGTPNAPSLVTVLAQRPGSVIWAHLKPLPGERPYSGLGDKAVFGSLIEPPKPDLGLDLGTGSADLDVLDAGHDLFLQVGVEGASGSTDRLDAMTTEVQTLTKTAFDRLTRS
jgi:hypothetical protein